jgi:hypothetical protein
MWEFLELFAGFVRVVAKPQNNHTIGNIQTGRYRFIKGQKAKRQKGQKAKRPYRYFTGNVNRNIEKIFTWLLA